MAYLDHAATTPMLPEAVEALTAHLGVTGNASSLHAAGRRARRTVEEARETLAEALGARPSEIVFTSGGTEADNLAVKGLYWSRRAADPARTRVLASPVEHHAVLDAVHWLGEHEGATVEYLPVDSHGRVHPDTLREAIASGRLDIRYNTIARKVLTDESGTRATGVEAIDTRTGEVQVLRARAVVLCASPIESVRLLTNEGRGGNGGHIANSSAIGGGGGGGGGRGGFGGRGRGRRW